MLWRSVVSGLRANPSPTLPCLKLSKANGLIRRNAALSLGTICLHGHPCGFLNNCDVTGHIAVPPNPSLSLCIRVWFCSNIVVVCPHACLCIFHVCHGPQVQCPKIYNSAAVLHRQNIVWFLRQYSHMEMKLTERNIHSLPHCIHLVWH